jgi:hypothetical protein
MKNQIIDSPGMTQWCQLKKKDTGPGLSGHTRLPGQGQKDPGQLAFLSLS